MTNERFGSDITFSVRSNAGRLHITVTNDLLIDRFRAVRGDGGIIKTLARYAPVITWMAFGKAAAERVDSVCIDLCSFDELESRLIAAAAVAKAKDESTFSQANVLAHECLRDTTADDSESVNIAAAIGLFMVLHPARAPHVDEQAEQADAEMWIFHALFESLRYGA